MKSSALFYIKLVHTLIFFFMVGCIAWTGYCAAARHYDWTLAIALGAIFLEGLLLLLNRFQCPITTLTQKLIGGNAAVTDVFCPEWIARNTFKIATVIVGIELIILAWGYFTS